MTSPATGHRCPRCGVALLPGPTSDVRVLLCTRCGGVRLDHPASLRALAILKGSSVDESDRQHGDVSRESSTWFDRHELVTITTAIAQQRGLDHDEVGDVLEVTLSLVAAIFG